MADGEMIDSEAIDSSSIELFWGHELSSKNKTYEYTGESDADEGIETTIEFRGACLGVDAKDERNIVNLTTEDIDGNEVTHTILSMRLDRNEQVPIYLSVKPPMKLELIQGSGPVSIVGNMMSVLGDISEDEMEDDDDDEEKEKQPLKRLVKAEYDDDNEKNKQALKKLGKSVLKSKDTQKKKRPADSPIEKPAKKNKRARPEEDDESNEEDSAMDASFEVPSLKQLKASLKDNDDEDEEDVDSDDDDDDDEESDDEEESETSDDDDDDDDDDLSDEESEEEEVKPPVKKGKGGKGSATVGKNKPGKGLSQTPVPKTQTKLKQQQAPSSVPKNTKKTSGKTPDIDQIKKRLLTSPSLPKKLDKFNNLLKANYKIHDDNTRKELWEFVQKTKK